MNSLTVSEQEKGFSIEGVAWEAVEEWSALCQRFLDWQRHEILQREPSPEKREQHRAGLKWLLRFAKAVYFTASDPDYPDRRVANELKGRLLQLEHSWRMVYEPMPEAEADQLLKEVFPE
jgi:hypothetical protein